MMIHLNSCNKMNQRTLKNNYYNSHKYSDNGISFRSDINSRNWNAEKNNNNQYNKKYNNKNNKRNNYNDDFPNKYDSNNNNNYNNKGRGSWTNIVDNGGNYADQEYVVDEYNDYNDFDQHDSYKNNRNKFDNNQNETNYYQQKQQQQQEMNEQFGGGGYFSGPYNNPSNMIINNNNSNNDYNRDENRDINNYNTMPNYMKLKNFIDNESYNSYNEDDTVVVAGNTNQSNYTQEMVKHSRDQSNRFERESNKNQNSWKNYDFRFDSKDSSHNNFPNAYDGYGNKTKQGYGPKYKSINYNVSNNTNSSDANDCDFFEQSFKEPNDDYSYDQYSADPQSSNQIKKNQRSGFCEPAKDWKHSNKDYELSYQNSSSSLDDTIKHQGQQNFLLPTNCPKELKDLLKLLECQLCGVSFNSTICSRLHYCSKAHEKNLNNWLYVNYIQKGYEVPPIQRPNQSEYITSKDLHCSVCDLRFTSVKHGQQHYEGRKHRINLQRHQTLELITQFDQQEGKKFDSEGDKIKQKNWPVVPATKSETDNLICKLCNVTATSPTQLDTHFHGAAHQRKYKLASMIIETDEEILKESAAYDKNNKYAPQNYEKFRTKNGQYYCGLCQVQVNHISILKQHLFGKKHLKREVLANSDYESC